VRLELEKTGNSFVTPAISVIVPTFNQGHFLREAIDSVLAQTFEKWELIVVDNFSSDSTSSLMSTYADPRIRYFKFRNHGVIGRSRNYGVSLAYSPFIAFLDSDDSWASKKLEMCIDCFGDKMVDIVCHAETWSGPKYPSRLIHYGPKHRCSFKKLVLLGNCLSTSAIVMRRQRFIDVGGFSEDGRINTAEDYDLWIRLARDGARFTFLRENLGNWRIHTAGTSQSAVKSRVAAYRVFDMYVESATRNRKFWRLRYILRLAGGLVLERLRFLKFKYND
jgi:glycosyltransferase involved in cell wall biosynthesis